MKNYYPHIILVGLVLFCSILILTIVAILLGEQNVLLRQNNASLQQKINTQAQTNLAPQAVNTNALAQPVATACTQDSDCKLIYSYCTCAAVPVTDTRKKLEIPGEALCETNNCQYSQTQAVCLNRQCVLNRNQAGNKLPLTINDVRANLAAGQVVKEIQPVNLNLPAQISAGQISKYFQLGDIYLALVLQPSLNIVLPNLPSDTAFPPAVLAARANQASWTKLLSISDLAPNAKNNPYYLWSQDQRIYLSIVDQNGAGSGEGIEKVFTLADNLQLQQLGCYYFGYIDASVNGDYFAFSQKLGDLQIYKGDECNNVKLEIPAN